MFYVGRMLGFGLSAILACCQGPAPQIDDVRVGPSQAADLPTSQHIIKRKSSQPTDVKGITLVRQLLKNDLREGMPYADFRQKVLAHGWTPLVDPQCKANVVGGNYEALCSEHPDLTSCQVCEQMPELSAYSGDGYGLMRFHKSGVDESLEVTSIGMISDWDVLGDDSRLQVVEWWFSEQPMH